MVKYILVFILGSSNVFAIWNCKNLDNTISVVSVESCSGIKMCIGYAECQLRDGSKHVGRVVCRQQANGICPDANECLDEAFSGEKITVAIQPENDPTGLYRFCNSDSKMLPLPQNGTDVINSRFCHTISGSYRDKEKDDLEGQMTGVGGGGSQTGSGRAK